MFYCFKQFHLVILFSSSRRFSVYSVFKSSCTVWHFFRLLFPNVGSLIEILHLDSVNVNGGTLL